MSDFKIPNTYTVLSNLTFFSPQQVPLGLKILDLNLNQQEKELFDLKSRYRDKLFVLEKEKQEIHKRNDELYTKSEKQKSFCMIKTK